MKDLFLCHTGADKDWVRDLASRLETEEAQGRRLEVWFDEWDIAHGTSIITAIGEGLASSRFVGVVLSPAMVKAGWPTAEWQSQVMDDPLNRRGRIIPILRHRFDPFTAEAIEIPWVLKPLKRFDFSRPNDFQVEYAKLVRHLRGLAPARGGDQVRAGPVVSTLSLGHHEPDNVAESLAGNLLVVSRLPEVVHSDRTNVKEYPTIWSAFPGKPVPAFALRDQRLFSFYSPKSQHNPFKRFLLGTDPQASSLAGLLQDVEKTKMLIGMLNAALKRHCWKLGVVHSKKDRSQFFCPVSTKGARFFQWGPGQRKRTLAKLVKGPKGKSFGVHYAARMRFTSVAGRLCLIVEPAWMFTHDGLTPIEGVEAGVLSTKWGGRERNAAVLRNVFMWGLLLARGRRTIRLGLGGDEYAEINSLPALAEASVGIEGDQVRIDRLLQGDGAGEVSLEGERLEELDIVANLALLGLADVDQSATHTERLADEGRDIEPELPL